MSHNSLKFFTHDRANSEEEKFILDGLIRYNDQFQKEDWRELTIVAKNDEGAILGGINGYTLWGWLFIKILWVDESTRKTGLGKSLITQAEQEAITRGCHSAYLDTFSFQAQDFYEKSGYVVVETLDRFPDTHQRFFMSKKLR